MSQELSFVLLSLLLLTTGGDASLYLKLSPPSVVLPYGHSVSINCSKLRDEGLGIGWEATKGGTGLKTVNHITWAVDQLVDWEGSPFCYIVIRNNSKTQPHRAFPTIMLYTFPDSIHISSTAGSERTMREGEQYNFTCEVPNVAPVGNLTVRLYRGDAVIDERTFNHSGKKPVNQSVAVGFVPSGDDNGVAFRCEAILDLERGGGPTLKVSSEPYNVTVTFGPVIQCSDSIVEWEKLEDLCKVTGNPTPFVMWQRDGEPVSSTLALSRNYTGTFLIVAEGNAVVNQTLQPAVMYHPELDCPSAYTALERSPHNLTCTVTGYPQPSVVWYGKDGEVVQLPENLTRREGGLYSIIASNSMGTANATVDITVVYPPSPIAELEDTNVEAGSLLWLKCSSTGNPRPQYRWSYYRADNAVEETDDGVSRLLIHNATFLNVGLYTCLAWNDRGNTSKTVRVGVTGAEPECPVKIFPEKMAIRYQSEGRNVTCEPTMSGSRNIEGKVSWQVRHGSRPSSNVLSVDPREDWDLQAVCTATFRGIGTCEKPFQFILYKTPDSVSVRRVDNLSAVVEKQQFQLRCDIAGVAPARHLTVQWFQGNRTILTQGKESLHVTGCPAEKVGGCDVSTTRWPVDVSSTITLALDGSDSGSMFGCKAQLDLGPDGPRLPLPMTSSPLNITVYYKPTINTTKLPKVVPVFRGYPEELICEAEGYPPPKVQWFYSTDKVPRVSGDMLLVTEAGYYNCSATNEVDSVFHVVEVVLTEDYLPLIAGLVAIMVIAISVVFVFIYSIYYKNTKMRRYSLKNPKPNPQNGNVAHNSWESQFPMTKLS